MGDSGGGRGGGPKDAGSKAALANQAQAFYSVGKYEKALECLQRLATQMGEKDDPRVQCNLVLTEHAKGGFKRPLVIRDRLGAIRNSLKERSNRTGAAARAAKDALRLKGQGAGGAEGEDDEGYGDALEEEEDEVDTTDTDTSILLYNLAALHFHEKQYGAAQQILHGLFARVEVLEEALGVHVCFLLLDVLLHSARGNLHTDSDRERFSQHTAALLAYLERPHSFGPPLPATGGDGEGDASTGSGSGSGKGLEMTEFAFRLHLYKAKVRLLQGEVKTSKKELKSALEIFQRELRPTPSDGLAGSKSGGGGGADSDDEDASAAPPPGAGGGNNLMGGYDASLPPAGVANVAALYLKANLEYLRLNFRKALKLLASCQKGEAGRLLPAGGPCYLNDMGVLHSKMGLPAVALQYFQKALACFDDAPPPSPTTAAPGGRPLEMDGRVLPHALCEVVYNTGVQLLLLGRYPQAFRCFENASLLFYNRPRLWLRMAECCVQQHREEERRRSGAVRDRLVRRVVGQGKHRRVLLPASGEESLRELAAAEAESAAAAAGSASSSAAAAGGGGRGKGGKEANGKGKGAAASTASASAAEDACQELRGQCSLRYAVKCLQNVLFLLSIASQGGGRSRLHVTTMLGGAKAAMMTASAGAEAGGASGAPPQPPLPTPSSSQSSQQDAAAAAGGAAAGADATGANVAQDESLLEQVALLNLAYVYLCLQEPVMALQCAEAVLSRGPAAVSEGRRVTAHTYAAEALCALGRPEKALRHLLPEGQPLPESGAVAALGEQRQSEAARHVLTADSFLPAEHFAARARSALHLNLANVYLLQNNLPMAERCVRAGLAACPTSPDALRSLVFILLRKGQTAAALEVLKSRRPTAAAAATAAAEG